MEASSKSFFGSSPADCYFPSLPQIHSPSLTHLPSAQTPSRRVINKRGFDLSFGNPEARVLLGNIVAPVHLSLLEALKDGCGHLHFNSKWLIRPVSLSFLALLVPIAQGGRWIHQRVSRLTERMQRAIFTGQCMSQCHWTSLLWLCKLMRSGGIECCKSYFHEGRCSELICKDWVSQLSFVFLSSLCTYATCIKTLFHLSVLILY